MQLNLNIPPICSNLQQSVPLTFIEQTCYSFLMIYEVHFLEISDI